MRTIPDTYFEVQITYEMLAKRCATGFLDMQENHHIMSIHVKLEVIVIQDFFIAQTGIIQLRCLSYGISRVRRVDMVALDMKKSVSVQVDSDFALLLPEGLYEIKKMEPRSRQRSIVVVCVFLAIAGMIIFGYFCNDQVSVL
uniref:Uncharacterized protein n=1 Tax=Phlebotomus papatasi TaxID=29031 RepID=A0A1B0DHJ6_PHLPP